MSPLNSNVWLIADTAKLSSSETDVISDDSSEEKTSCLKTEPQGTVSGSEAILSTGQKSIFPIGNYSKSNSIFSEHDNTCKLIVFVIRIAEVWQDQTIRDSGMYPESGFQNFPPLCYCVIKTAAGLCDTAELQTCSIHFKYIRSFSLTARQQATWNTRLAQFEQQPTCQSIFILACTFTC